MNAPTKMLVKLAQKSASTWTAMAAQAFHGEAFLETGNSVYRFRDGVFAGCARKPSPIFAQGGALEGVRLIGFLAYDRGLWSLSSRWQKGVLAVFWRGGADERSFIVTSATLAWHLGAPAPAPVLRRPAPPSMTRVLPAAASHADLR